MPTNIALAGGEEFRAGCEAMALEMLRHYGLHAPRVLIIPTAADTAPNRAAKNGVDYFERLGTDAFDLMILNKSDANDNELIHGIHEADIIYFTGGNPDHLLDSLNGTILLKSIQLALKNGAVLAGSSAGAMVLGTFMRRPGLGEWVKGLGIANNIAGLPHHENSDPEKTADDLKSAVPQNITILGIDAKTACVKNSNEWLVTGTGNVTAYKNGLWNIYKSGDSFI